jgi:TRAP-type transport system periplasmic protein
LRHARLIGGVLALLVGPQLGSPARADASLTMNVAMPRSSSFFIGVYQPWKEAVERESQGRIKIEMPAASLAPPARQWEMVTSGVADVALSPNDFIRQRVKLPFLAEIPFLAPNSMAASLALWRTQLKFFSPADEYKGVKLLGLWVNGGNTLQTIHRPVTRIEDFRGLKLWTPTPNTMALVEALGGTPVAAQGANSLFDYMSGGIVDGAVSGKGSLISFQLARYTKYITVFAGQLGYNGYSFFMNEKAYQRLAPEDRAVIDRVSYEPMVRRAAQGFIDNDNLGDAAIKENAIAVTEASPELMAAARARASFLKAEWLAAAKERGIDGPAAYDWFAASAKEIAAQSP